MASVSMSLIGSSQRLVPIRQSVHKVVGPTPFSGSEATASNNFRIGTSTPSTPSLMCRSPYSEARAALQTTPFPQYVAVTTPTGHFRQAHTQAPVFMFKVATVDQAPRQSRHSTPAVIRQNSQPVQVQTPPVAITSRRGTVPMTSKDVTAVSVPVTSDFPKPSKALIQAFEDISSEEDSPRSRPALVFDSEPSVEQFSRRNSKSSLLGLELKLEAINELPPKEEVDLSEMSPISWRSYVVSSSTTLLASSSRGERSRAASFESEVDALQESSTSSCVRAGACSQQEEIDHLKAELMQERRRNEALKTAFKGMLAAWQEAEMRDLKEFERCMQQLRNENSSLQQQVAQLSRSNSTATPSPASSFTFESPGSGRSSSRSSDCLSPGFITKEALAM